MKKRLAASCSIQQDTATAVRIATGDQTPYRVVWTETVAAVATFSPRAQRDLLGPSAPVCQVLPADDVFYLILPLPPMAARLRPATLRGVIAREKGGDPGDWAVDFTQLPPVGTGRRAAREDMGALFARREVVARHHERGRALGVRPSLMLPTYALLDRLYRLQRPADHTAAAWNLVYLGGDARFLCVGEPGGLLFSRPLPEDLSQGAEKDEYLDRLTTEVERSNFFAQQAERSLHVGQIVVCGDPDLADALAERLAANREMPVVRWRPEDLFTWPDAAARADLVLTLAGAVAALDRHGFNLLPPEARPARGRTARRHALLAGTTAAVAAAPLLLAAALWTRAVQRDALLAITAEETGLVTQAQATATAYLENRVLAKREENLRRYGSARVDLEQMLLALAARTPADVVYRDLSLTQDAEGRYHLTLVGESRGRDGLDAQQVFVAFLADLRSCGQFQDVTEPSQVEIAAVGDDTGTGSRVSFTLEYLVVEAGSS